MKKTGFYTKKVLEHFQKPHNFGKIKNSNAIGQAGNVVCGDVMQLYLKIVKDKKGREIIEDVSFETFGCVAAIATSSVITDLVKGKTLDKVLDFDKEKIVKELGGLPPIKLHCSVLAADALYDAIYNYLKKQKRKIPEKLKLAHMRIESSQKKIEKEYKDWVHIEKEMYKKSSPR
ncbi:MAG: iron-sulfur cluster assembly scaffold protein [Candidatus Paceibacterota bacterium]|jgi:nitrogen fixation NifU-like protein